MSDSRERGPDLDAETHGIVRRLQAGAMTATSVPLGPGPHLASLVGAWIAIALNLFAERRNAARSLLARSHAEREARPASSETFRSRAIA